MKIGVDGRKIPGAADRTPVEILGYAHDLGMEGVYFRTVLDISPTLDRGLLREVRQEADRLGLYLQMGLGKVNPYAAAEAPEIRRLGDGDYTRGMLRMLEACREGADCGELWVACCNYQPDLPGYYAIDRFRTDAPWADQLVAIEKFLRLLAPAARDLGCHLNMETHEEITSTEVVRLVESVGPDVMGITFDTANVLVRGEDPVAAARRVAPYVRATHLRDSILRRTDTGLTRTFSPCGLGVIDWAGLLGALLEQVPDLDASIEPADRRWPSRSGRATSPGARCTPTSSRPRSSNWNASPTTTTAGRPRRGTHAGGLPRDTVRRRELRPAQRRAPAHDPRGPAGAERPGRREQLT